VDLYQKALSTFIDLSASYVAPLPALFPPLEKHRYALEKRRILHPFLGEMGLEIRGFLGSIEPWLRNGWVIPARRTALYRPLTAFEDPPYFERINAIKSAYGLREITGRLDKIIGPRIAASTAMDETTFQLIMSADIANDLQQALAARRELRHAFFERYGHDQLLPTRWHTKLSSQCHGDDDFEECARWAVVPNYLPPYFENPPFEFPRHVGIQLRNVPQNPQRNSDPERMGRLAAEASAILDLPIILYGQGEDFSLPDVQRTVDLIPAGTAQLSAELVFLKHCALMISPDSGWTDLMGWLRVPTLLERIYFPWGFEGLRPFSPRITLANEADLRASIETVLAPDIECVLPDPHLGETTSEFLSPVGDACVAFWRDFLGRD
jgi:hypothetical protein